MGRASLESNRAREPGRLRQWLVLALAAVVPPLIAFGIEDFVWPSVTRWLLFNAAVIASSWLGGLKSGLAATALSTMLVFEFFLPPAQSLGRASYRSYVTAGLFVVIGVAISAFHERLRRARQAAAVALAESRRATADLG
ncbi:MAG: DUF4118 domain-containing protein, partial [Gemmatimonadaceae bacterium]